MSRYLIYCRKSSEAEDRQVLSIESQVSELSRLTDKQGHFSAEILTEARSAKAPGRPVFNDMMQRIYRGEAQGIICWKLDRLARNPIDGGAVIWAMKQHGIEIITPTQTFRHADDNTILMYIEFGMAQKYIDDLSRNVKRGLRTKVEKGWYPAVAPLGYLNNKYKDKGEKDIVKDPERFPLIRQMWDLMLTGRYTPPRILEIANNEWGFRTRQMKRLGGNPLGRSSIYRIFTNPFYCGWFEYPVGSGQWHKGSHEPMISRKEYDRVQTLLGTKGNPRAVTHSFTFTGMIRCGECGAMVTAEEKHQLICSACRQKFAYRQRDRCPSCCTSIEKMENPKLLHYTYYHCSKSRKTRCTQKSIKAAELERQIDAYLARIEISEAFRDWSIRYLPEVYGQEIADEAAVLQSQQQAYQDCLHRIGNLLKLKTSPGNNDGSLLSDEEYGKEREQLLREKTQLEELISAPGHQAEKAVSVTGKIYELACSARSWFAQGSAEVKKEILGSIGSNLTLRDKILCIEAKKPFMLLEKPVPCPTWVQSVFEPEKNGSIKAQSDLFGVGLRSQLPRKDDVRTYAAGKRLEWHLVTKEILLHVMTCEKECPQLEVQLDNLFSMTSEYQRQAA